MRLIDADKLKRKAQKVGTEAWKMNLTAKVETTLNQFIDWIDEQPTIQCEPQWMLITERLPRDGSWNIFTDGKNISVERYKADAIDHFFPNGRWFQLEDVIAWMPLPTPYTK